jgi:hypothetical protein
MFSDHPTGDQIRDADAVLLFDHSRDWQELVGSMRTESPSYYGLPKQHTGFFLRIPVDSTNAANVQGWRDRIIGIRGDLPKELAGRN